MLRADEPSLPDPCPSIPRHVLDWVARAGERLREVASLGARAPGIPAPPPPRNRRLAVSRRIVVAAGWGDGPARRRI